MWGKGLKMRVYMEPLKRRYQFRSPQLPNYMKQGNLPWVKIVVLVNTYPMVYITFTFVHSESKIPLHEKKIIFGGKKVGFSVFLGLGDGLLHRCLKQNCRTSQEDQNCSRLFCPICLSGGTRTSKNDKCIANFNRSRHLPVLYGVFR